MEDFVDEALRKHGPSTDTTDRLNEMRKALNQYSSLFWQFRLSVCSTPAKEVPPTVANEKSRLLEFCIAFNPNENE